MNYIDNEDNDTGRVKGSSKDRVISFFYRKRYKAKLTKQRKIIVVPRRIIINVPRLKRNIYSRVNILSDLKLKGLNYIAVDPNCEKFEFDKYDYYIIKPVKSKGIGNDDMIEPVKGRLSKMSSISIKGLDYRIKDTKKLVDDTKKKLNSVRINLEYPVLHREDLSKMYSDVRENINDLKYEYEILKGETNNRSYPFEEAIKIMDNITSYDKNSIKKMDDMLSVASLELNRLELNNNIKNKKDDMEQNKKIDIKEEVISSNLYSKPKDIDEKIDDEEIKKEYVEKIILDNVEKKEEKKEEVIETDIKEKEVGIELSRGNDNLINEKEEEMVTIKLPKEDVINHRRLKEINLDIVSIKTYEEKIAYELQRQREIIHKMYSKVGKVTKEINKTYQITGYGRMISSFGNIAMGMLTLPLTNVHILNLTLGTKLVNKGIKKLRKGLDKKEKITVDYKYEDLSSSISKGKNELESVNYLIIDSLEELEQLRRSFINEFKSFEYQISDYDKTLKNIDNLSDKLRANKIKLKDMNNDLSKQAEKNKVMIKKINNREY